MPPASGHWNQFPSSHLPACTHVAQLVVQHACFLPSLSFIYSIHNMTSPDTSLKSFLKSSLTPYFHTPSQKVYSLPEIPNLSFYKLIHLLIALIEMIWAEIIHWGGRRNRWPYNHIPHAFIQTSIYWAPTMYQSPLQVLAIQIPVRLSHCCQRICKEWQIS